MKNLARIWLDDEDCIRMAIDIDGPLTRDEYDELGQLLRRIVDRTKKRNPSERQLIRGKQA